MTEVPTNTIGYGIDTQSFYPSLSGEDEDASRQKWHLPHGVPLLLHVGRLDTEKRVDRVVRAAAKSMDTSNAHLLMVGDGTQKPALMKLCESLGIADRVHFLGFISVKDGLPELYRLADLFVVASEIETQGIVLLEAAASGLPIVAVRATCIPEIVQDGKNGYLAPPGDLDELENAMSLLLSNPEKAGRMGQASFALAAKHTQACTEQAYEQLYGQVVQQVQRQVIQPEERFQYELWRRVKS